MSIIEQRVVDVLRQHMQLREQFLRHNMADGFRGALHPALTIAVLPSGAYATVHQCLSLLHSLFDPHATHASYASPPASSLSVVPIVEDIKQCFGAAEMFEHAVQLKKEIGQTLKELLTIVTRPAAATVSEKPYASPEALSFAGGLPMDAWQHVASYLPVDDLVHLPLVGHLFFAYRSYIVWCNLYVRCFGKYTPAQLSIVAPWDFIDADDNGLNRDSAELAVEVCDNAPLLDGGDEGAGLDICSEEADDGLLLSNFDIDYRLVLRNALLPLLLASKKIFMLQPSPDAFFDRIAPRGAVTLGCHRLLLVNASPLHLITLRRAHLHIRSMEVVTEEMMTTQGPIRLITLGVAVGYYAQQLSVIHSSLALTPGARRAVAAIFAEQAASELYGFSS